MIKLHGSSSNVYTAEQVVYDPLIHTQLQHNNNNYFSTLTQTQDNKDKQAKLS